MQLQTPPANGEALVRVTLSYELKLNSIVGLMTPAGYDIRPQRAGLQLELPCWYMEGAQMSPPFLFDSLFA